MTQVQSFLIEILNRIRSKSPRFFFILSIIFGLLTIASKIPYVMKYWLDVDLASNFVKMFNDIALISSGIFAMTFLPVKTQPVAQTKQGEAIMVTDEKKLPFTAKAEEKKMDEAVPPPPVIKVPENKT